MVPEPPRAERRLGGTVTKPGQREAADSGANGGPGSSGGSSKGGGDLSDHALGRWGGCWRRRSAAG